MVYIMIALTFYLSFSMELFSTLTFLIFLISLYLFLHYYQIRAKKPNTCAIIKNYPILGDLTELIKNRDRILDWFTETLKQNPKNTIILNRPFYVPSIETANPSNVEYLAKTNFENYPKSDRLLSILRELLGHGIFSSDGERWKVQRKAVSHEFSTKSLKNFIVESVIFEIKTRLIPILEKASETGQVLNLQDVLERFAFDNICKLAFDVDPACLEGYGTTAAANAGDEMMRAFEEAVELSSSRYKYLIPFVWKIKKFLNVGSEKRLKESIATVHKFADSIIKSRKESAKAVENNKDDLLSRFISNNELNSPESLRDTVTNLILAGRDTTSSALSWFFWLLSSRPQIQQNILKELNSIRVRTGKNIGDSYGFDEIRSMQYLHAAISETMRLYPPVPVEARVSQKDDVLPDGTFVSKDCIVSFYPYAMGRLESIWGENCLEFKPERWLVNGVFQPENPYRYPIFHSGPRMCLGKDMAYIQMNSIAAAVIERFEIEYVMRKDHVKAPEPLLSVTLRMKGGLPVRVTKRSI